MRHRHLFAAAMACFLLVPGCANLCKTETSTSFGYTGRSAPQFWSGLKSDYAVCGDGHAQSPIDIKTADVIVDANLPRIQTGYHNVDAVLVNNGHTLEIEYHEGSKVTFGGEEYELLQFHFHSLSEHRVDGVPAEMEAHLVHRNANGGLLVIGVFMVVGAENSFLAKFWNQFPIDTEERHTRIDIDAADLLPSDLSYYTYQGSLTTPPCSEIVTWVVLKKPIEVSRAQLDFFTLTIGNNARPVQDLNGRTVKSAR